jgi:hypothetical protein
MLCVLLWPYFKKVGSVSSSTTFCFHLASAIVLLCPSVGGCNLIYRSEKMFWVRVSLFTLLPFFFIVGRVRVKYTKFKTIKGFNNLCLIVAP